MKIHYVGKKEGGETAYSDLTGIPRWMPGDSHEIANPSVASRLLQHPDVFSKEPADDEPGESTSPTQEQLDAALAALPGSHTDPDYVVGAMRAHFGALFTADDEAEVREVVKKPEPVQPNGGEPADAAGAQANTTGEQVQETAPPAADTAGMSLAPGGTIAAPPAPAAKSTGKARK